MAVTLIAGVAASRPVTGGDNERAVFQKKPQQAVILCNILHFQADVRLLDFLINGISADRS